MKNLKDVILEATDSYEYEKYISSDIIKDMMITNFIQQGRMNQLYVANRKNPKKPIIISSQKELDDIASWYNNTTYKKDKLKLKYMFTDGVIFDFTNVDKIDIDFHGMDINCTYDTDSVVYFKVSNQLVIRNVTINCYNMVIENASEDKTGLYFDKHCDIRVTNLYNDNVNMESGISDTIKPGSKHFRTDKIYDDIPKAFKSIINIYIK